jgi:hypothetical protein
MPRRRESVAVSRLCECTTTPSDTMVITRTASAADDLAPALDAARLRRHLDPV